MGHAQTIRHHPTFVAGDSGLIIYRNNGGKKLPHLDFTVFTSWPQLTVSIGSGWAPVQWERDLRAFIERHSELLYTPLGGQGRRFPPTVRCFIFDNLNGAMDKQNRFSTAAYRPMLDPLLDLLDHFVAPVYTCSASAERWEADPSFDIVSEEVRGLVKARNLIARTGDHFWGLLVGLPTTYDG